MTDDARLAELAETTALIARPGLSVVAEDDHLLIKVLSRSDPPTDLVVFRATPIDDGWSSRFNELVKSFDEFNDVASAIADRAADWDLAISLAQTMYNKGVVLNSHGWYDDLRFDYAYLEEDMSKWRR
jgi:hypothetical protein